MQRLYLYTSMVMCNYITILGGTALLESKCKIYMGNGGLCHHVCVCSGQVTALAKYSTLTVDPLKYTRVAL